MWVDWIVRQSFTRLTRPTIDTWMSIICKHIMWVPYITDCITNLRQPDCGCHEQAFEQAKKTSKFYTTDPLGEFPNKGSVIWNLDVFHHSHATRAFGVSFHISSNSSKSHQTHYDNLWSHQWQQSCQIDDLLISVAHIKDTIKTLYYYSN